MGKNKKLNKTKAKRKAAQTKNQAQPENRKPQLRLVQQELPVLVRGADVNAPSDSEEDADPFKPWDRGTEVTAIRLSTAVNLNGHTGVIVRWVSSKARYEVNFNGDTKSIKPANLVTTAKKNTSSKPTCSNVDCVLPAGQSCQGCLQAWYCSRTCQKVDWKQGGHRLRCKELTTAAVAAATNELVVHEIAIDRDFREMAQLWASISGDLDGDKPQPTPGRGTIAHTDESEKPMGTCWICLDALDTIHSG